MGTPHLALCVLPYDELWSRFTSATVDWTAAVPVENKGTSVLEFRSDLASSRTAAAGASTPTRPAEDVVKGAHAYLAAVGYLANREADLADSRRPPDFQWTSAMLPPGVFGPHLLRAPPGFAAALHFDRGMMLLRMVAALWQSAQTRAAAIAGPQSEQVAGSSAAEAPDASDGLAACVAELRRASGAAEFLADAYWPQFEKSAGGWIDKSQPPEMQPWFARMLAALLRGLAQQLWTDRYLLGESSLGLAAKLYAGAAETFEAAAAEARRASAAGFKPASHLLRRFIAVNATTSEALARCCQARALLADGEAAAAAHLAMHCRNELARGAYVAEGERAWLTVLDALGEGVTAVWRAAEHERMHLYMQPPWKKPTPELPEGRALMTGVPFSWPEYEQDVDPEL